MKKTFLLIIGIALSFIIFLNFAQASTTYYYYFTSDTYNSAASTTQYINTNFTGYCTLKSGTSGVSTSYTASSYLQWNTSEIAWSNATVGTGHYVNINGSNPDTTVKTTTSKNTNYNEPAHAINFNQTGVYNLRCFEPSESADSSTALTSAAVQYTAVAPSNISIILNSPLDFYNSSSSNVSPSMAQ